MNTKYFSISIIVLFLHASALLAYETIELCQGSSVRFASGDLAKTLLTQNDEYIRALTPFDLKARCGINKGATKALYLDMLANEVLPWNQAEKQNVKKSIEYYKSAMNQLGLTFPPVINLIKIKDGMYQSLAYTRLSFIVLTESCLKYGGFGRHLFPHELFHVYSRYHRDISDKLYKLIGFEDVGKLVLPQSMADRKLNNPDYVHDYYSIEVECKTGDYRGKKLRVFPFVISEYEGVEPDKSVRDYYIEGFALLAVKQESQYFVPITKNGEPLLLIPELTNFNKITRLNSDYNVGPEEIMAENFVFLLEEMVTKKRYVSSADVIDEMKAIFVQYKKD